MKSEGRYKCFPFNPWISFWQK